MLLIITCTLSKIISAGTKRSEPSRGNSASENKNNKGNFHNRKYDLMFDLYTRKVELNVLDTWVTYNQILSNEIFDKQRENLHSAHVTINHYPVLVLLHKHLPPRCKNDDRPKLRFYVLFL